MNSLDTAFYDKLAAGTALTARLGGTFVYNTLAPRNKALNYVIFAQQDGREDDETPRRTLTFPYLAKGVATTLEEAGVLADMIDAILHDATLNVSGWTNYWLHRETMVRYIETTDAGEYIGHAGAVYTVRLSE